MNSFEHPGDVYEISLQPETNGNVFATICDDDTFRLFDTRQSGTGELSQRDSKNDQLKAF